ncbi:uncharacterized protein BDR25DRAFT_348329 [Lindgomyces ingoldianus]|uniref:Uncharacterized protein n=1 Tax=Lindgomyces ingoldianus TaxID=673940 RepID=A0ACB6RG10_9PLEO|nr:uncharacterized protein BDR25DRAFT_348329 [Lindgomyces ingoldianus]KAF2478046.1 hypothetical protein BDR25DRAFT_348329 [Lindgomyces ingoldianus]
MFIAAGRTRRAGRISYAEPFTTIRERVNGMSDCVLKPHLVAEHQDLCPNHHDNDGYNAHRATTPPPSQAAAAAIEVSHKHKKQKRGLEEGFRGRRYRQYGMNFCVSLNLFHRVVTISFKALQKILLVIIGLAHSAVTLILVWFILKLKVNSIPSILGVGMNGVDKLDDTRHIESGSDGEGRNTVILEQVSSPWSLVGLGVEKVSPRHEEPRRCPASGQLCISENSDGG